jgi:hypothetical protein
MAHTVSGYIQSDDLFLMRLTDGRIVGYSSEFGCCTYDVREACSEGTHRSAKWFPASGFDQKDWVPATLDEIKAVKLEKYLIGSVEEMDLDCPIEPI